MQTQKYDMIVQSMIEMGVDVVYPVELPNQSSLTIDGKNCFEPVVCIRLSDLHCMYADMMQTLSSRIV
jgi:amidase